MDATRFGAISLQDIDPLAVAIPGAERNFYAADARADEDCLNLNVWSVDPAGRAPVYVYIHGGAFLCGSGTGEWISGARQARENGIVVVTINYRLGLLGGLFLGDHDRRASNLAIQDQIQALAWVRDNIAAFGGDPDRVTVGGESAGAMSTVALLCAPAARGLFRRAVVESGNAASFVPIEVARRATELVLARLHIRAGEDVLARLRATSTLRLAAVQRELGVAIGTFPMVADGVVIDADPLAAIAAGAARDVDLLIGTTREEDRLFGITGWAPAPRPLADVAARLLPAGPGRDRLVELYTALAGEQGLDAETVEHLVATEHDWTEPARELALAHADSGGRTYHFEFAWSSSVDRVGSAHLIDLPFFFGNLDAPGVSELLGADVQNDPATIALGRKVSGSLAQFVRDGDLSAGPLGAWPVYTDADRATMIMDRVPRVERRHLAERLDFWASQRAVSARPLSTITGDR